nr:hypothetical protein [Tanacetum cinerariifolium]
MIGLGYESIHASEHDCCLFRGDDNKDLDFCPVCNTSRCKDSNTLGKKVPKKVMRYFLIIPRLQRLYKSSHTAKEMIWYATGKCMEPGKMQHSVDGRAWKNFDTNPEIDAYRSQFKSLFHNKDIKEEFPDLFGSQIRQRHVDNDKDPEFSTTSELFALPCGPTWTPISINSCVVDGVRYVVHSRDERRITQNSGICSPGPDREMYYDDDITDDEDALPHDLADFDNEDLINVDDDGVDKVYSSEEED